MIELIDLTKIYLGPNGRLEENVQALSNITLKVREGDVVAITGESGSGKTTLLNILASRMEPTTGSVLINNIPIHMLPMQELQEYWRSKVHYIHQNMRENLQYDLTVNENYEIFEILSDSIDQDVLRKYTSDLGIEKLLDTKVQYLSGGEKQMVCLGIAMAKNSELLILDEPTSALDEINKHVVIEKIIQKCRENNITLIYTSHDPEISQYADVIIGINHGRFDRILKGQISKSNVKELVQGIYHEVPVDSKGAIHLPRFVIEKLEIGEMVEIRLEEDHLRIYPIKEERNQ